MTHCQNCETSHLLWRVACLCPHITGLLVILPLTDVYITLYNLLYLLWQFFLYDSIYITFKYKLKKTIRFRDACLSGKTLEQMKEMIIMMLGKPRLWGGGGKHVWLGRGMCRPSGGLAMFYFFTWVELPRGSFCNNLSSIFMAYALCACVDTLSYTHQTNKFKKWKENQYLLLCHSNHDWLLVMEF